MTITMLGSGAWGTALANLLCENGHTVYLWTRSAQRAEAMKQSGVNPRLQGVSLHAALQPVSDFSSLTESTMVVFASPIYYFTLSAQLQAAIHRTYSIDIPQNVKQTALIMSSGDRFVYGPAITQYYQSIVEYWKVRNAGIFTSAGDDNKSEQKYKELYEFGKSL